MIPFGLLIELNVCRFALGVLAVIEDMWNRGCFGFAYMFRHIHLPCGIFLRSMFDDRAIATHAMEVQLFLSEIRIS